MKKLLLIIACFISIAAIGQRGKDKYGMYVFKDSVYFKNVPYNSGAGVVHLGIDTVPGSPTFGKLVRKTAGGSTPTLQQVLDAGSTLTSSETISTGAFKLTVLSTSGTDEGLFAQNVSGGRAFFAQTGTGTAIYSQSNSGLPFSGVLTNSGQSTTIESFRSDRQTTGGGGVGQDGIGQFWGLYNHTSTTPTMLSNAIISRFKLATHASRTAQFGLTTTINTFTDTSITVGDYVTLTESSATKFTSTTIATGKIQGGSILVTVEANDATDFQARTLRFIWSAVNKAGTLTITISTPEEVVALSSGTLTCTITAVDAGSGVLDFKANAVSSLTQSTLRATYQTFKNF